MFSGMAREARTKNKTGVKKIHSIHVILNSGSLSDLTKQKINLGRTPALTSILPVLLKPSLETIASKTGEDIDSSRQMCLWGHSKLLLGLGEYSIKKSVRDVTT